MNFAQATTPAGEEGGTRTRTSFRITADLANRCLTS